MCNVFTQQNAVDLHRVATASWLCGNGGEKSYISCQKLECLSLHSFLSAGRR